MEAPASSLATLPTVLLGEVVRLLLSPFDVARLDCTARLFHLGEPRSAVEEGLRLRAEAAGRAVEAALPADEPSWTQWLLWQERRLLACAPPVTSSGADHCAFVEAGGQLLTCGRDLESIGLLGQCQGVAESSVPRAVAGLCGVRIRTVSAGIYHTLACCDEGRAYSYGDGRHGELGHGDPIDLATQNTPVPTPRLIEALQGVHISAVAAGGFHSLVLDWAGKVYSFGDGCVGALGHGIFDRHHHFAPQLVAALQGVRVSAVAAGGAHSLALSEAGEVRSFGRGLYGALGHGDEVDRYTPWPIAALQGVRVGALAAGGDHSLVVSVAGRLYTFGRGDVGQLGHNDTAEQFAILHESNHLLATQLAPRLVAALQGVRVSAVAAGNEHSLVLSEGKVYSCGRGAHGRLGHGLDSHGLPDTATQRRPRVIAGLQGVRVRSVAAGNFTGLAVTAEGEVYGWGRGTSPIMGGYGVPQQGGTQVPNPVLGLGDLTEHQLVPLKYPGLCLRACAQPER
jgi:alpha-tubulin suppressor-like RCC1 family protein